LEIFNSGGAGLGYFVRILEITDHFVINLNHIVPTLLLLLLSASASLAQQPLIDSLENALKKDASDSVRVRQLGNLANAYVFIDNQKAREYGRQSMELADQTSDNGLKAWAYQNLSLLYSLGGDFTTALKFETSSLKYSILNKDSISIGLSYSNIGNDYHELGEYDEAYFYLTQSYRILKRVAKNQTDSLYMNIALHNVGRVFKELGQYDFALTHFKFSQRVSEELGDKEGRAYSFDEIGDVKLRMKQYDSALFYLTKALWETRKLMREDAQSNVKELHPKVLHKIAKTYLRKGNYDLAMAYYDSARHVHHLTNNEFGIAEVQLGQGSVYMMQNKYDDAIRLIEGALVKATALNARVLEQSCYTHLSELWEKKGDFKKSLLYYKQFKVLQDSLFSQEMQQKLFRDQVRFETQSKDEQIEALTQMEEFQKLEIRKQEFIRNILVVMMALTAILLFTVYRSGQRRRRINALLLQHQEDMEKRSEELEQLNQVKDKFFSIISHDLRSPINALAGLLDLLEKDAIKPEELPMAMRELRTRFNHTRTLLNNLLDWTLLQMDKLSLSPAKIDLHKLVDENMEMLRALQGKSITMINNLPRHAFAYADSNTVNLVIRNLITNALKFTNDGGEIMVTGELSGGRWTISVHDNGIGIPAEHQAKLFDKVNPYSTRGTANEKGTGLGLILCKEFVEKNGGKIWVESEEGKGSTFSFSIPAHD
jgi:signal transduction histidine kinase